MKEEGKEGKARGRFKSRVRTMAAFPVVQVQLSQTEPAIGCAVILRSSPIAIGRCQVVGELMVARTSAISSRSNSGIRHDISDKLEQ
jgi:hypothetical protein